MVDFVLKNAGVPAGGVDDHGLALVVQRLDPNRAGARHDRLEALQAQAAFIEFHKFAAELETRVGNNLKRDGTSLSYQGFPYVLYDRQLERQADLRGGQSDAGRPAHRFPHEFNELLYFGRDDFGGLETLTCLPEYRLTDLNNLQTHAQIVPENAANKIFRGPLLFACGGSTFVET